MDLTLYLHPLSSFCHKVLIALYETNVDFHPQIVDLADPVSSATLRENWPLGKIPMLHDGSRDRFIAETSIIIEYVQEHFPGPIKLLPVEDEARLQVRLWDRIFDLYVNVPMQRIVGERLRPEGHKDAFGVTDARKTLDITYAMIEKQLASYPWATGEHFTLADCAAVPALFYASIVHPFKDEQIHLRSYFERLLERSSVQRTLAEARPYFNLFPYLDAMPARFRNPQAS